MTTYRQFNFFTQVFILLAVSLVTFSSCNSDDDDDTLLGEWYEKSDFEGVSRSGAVVVTINNKAYMGTGFDGTDWLRDWWEYDPELDQWDEKTAFPGAVRTSAVAFTINGKAYVGTGYDGKNNLKDFWEYDPVADEWNQIADFEGTARYGALAFAIGDRGFVGTGYDGKWLKDIWEYKPGKNQWEQKASVGGSKRTNAFVFVINDKAYVGGGTNNNVIEYDFWEFDPVENDSIGDWDEMTALDDDDQDYNVARELSSAFVINGYGYVACGAIGSINSEVWEYDATTDLWTEKTTFEGSSRESAIGFAIGAKGYISTGRNSSMRYDDLWQFDPLAEDTDD